MKKGQKMSEEQKLKIGNANKGKISWAKGKLGADAPNWKGGLLSEFCLNCSSIFKTTGSRKGKYCSVPCANIGNSGKLNPSWKGGLTIGENKKLYYRRKCLERISAKKGASGSHSFLEWQDLKKKFNFMCLCCKEQEPFIKLTEDHIIPLARGGSDYIDNIQPLCQSCNSRKNAKILNFIKIFKFSN